MENVATTPSRRVAALTFDDAAYRATLIGDGNDRRSVTRLSATVVVTLTEAGSAATELAIEISYALRGPLAQLARGPILQAFASGAAESWARSLESRLAAGPAAVGPARLALFGCWLGSFGNSCTVGCARDERRYIGPAPP